MNINDVQTLINELEQREAISPVCNRLASLYIIRDHMTDEGAYAPNTVVNTQTNTEFLRAIDGKDFYDVIKRVNSFADEISVTNPFLYLRFINFITGEETKHECTTTTC